KIFSLQPQIPLSDAVLQLDQLVRKSLRQQMSDSESDEGCDGAFVRIQLSNRTIEYIGAKINMYELNAQGDVELHKADRISLGYRDAPHATPTAKAWTLTSGSRFVLVTDGVTDQLGGSGSAPVAFGYKRLQHALVQSSQEGAKAIASQLLASVTAWQGTLARRDDLTIIAMEV
ncbi:MAG: hypothetical protein EBW49_08460, partial [Betaproteobacteria bacterium]|nr:hypothetical protein [Betaproteobacteria bacterium]